jgi:hypothetical protein
VRELLQEVRGRTENVAEELSKGGFMRGGKEFRVVEEITEGAEHEGLLIDNCLFPLDPPKEGDGPLDKEDNELFALNGLEEMLRYIAPSTLIHRYEIDTWQKWLMLLVPHVARYYGVEREKLLSSWIDNWWPSIVSGSVIPIWLYVPGEAVMSKEEALASWIRHKEKK